MQGALIEVAAAVVVTAALLLAPGAALISAMRAWRPIPTLLRPAGAVLGSILLASPVLNHRLLVTAEAQFAGITVEQVIAQILAEVSPPTERIAS